MYIFCRSHCFSIDYTPEYQYLESGLYTLYFYTHEHIVYTAGAHCSGPLSSSAAAFLYVSTYTGSVGIHHHLQLLLIFSSGSVYESIIIVIVR